MSFKFYTPELENNYINNGWWRSKWIAIQGNTARGIEVTPFAPCAAFANFCNI